MAPNALFLFLVNLAVVLGVVGFATFIVLIMLRRADQRRMQEGKLAAVGTATARILHQIKNPLQTILLHSEILEDPRDLMGAAERREASRAIASEAERLGTMLAELSQWAAGTRRQLSLMPVPLDAVVRRLAQQAEAHTGLSVEARIGERVHVLADAYFLHQALDNLVRNAAEAMRDQDDARLLIALERTGRTAVVCVRDNGPGIPRDRLEQIFEPFVSSKGSGMGLGLAITREIVDGHGGTIKVESTQGVGTTFRVSLPVSSEVAAAPRLQREEVLA